MSFAEQNGDKRILLLKRFVTDSRNLVTSIYQATEERTRKEFIYSSQIMVSQMLQLLTGNCPSELQTELAAVTAQLFRVAVLKGMNSVRRTDLHESVSTGVQTGQQVFAMLARHRLGGAQTDRQDYVSLVRQKQTEDKCVSTIDLNLPKFDSLQQMLSEESEVKIQKEVQSLYIELQSFINRRNFMQQHVDELVRKHNCSKQEFYQQEMLIVNTCKRINELREFEIALFKERVEDSLTFREKDDVADLHGRVDSRLQQVFLQLKRLFGNYQQQISYMEEQIDKQCKLIKQQSLRIAKVQKNDKDKFKRGGGERIERRPQPKPEEPKRSLREDRKEEVPDAVRYAGRQLENVEVVSSLILQIKRVVSKGDWQALRKIQDFISKTSAKGDSPGFQQSLKSIGTSIAKISQGISNNQPEEISSAMLTFDDTYRAQRQKQKRLINQVSKYNTHYLKYLTTSKNSLRQVDCISEGPEDQQMRKRVQLELEEAELERERSLQLFQKERISITKSQVDKLQKTVSEKDMLIKELNNKILLLSLQQHQPREERPDPFEKVRMSQNKKKTTHRLTLVRQNEYLEAQNQNLAHELEQANEDRQELLQAKTKEIEALQKEVVCLKANLSNMRFLHELESKEEEHNRSVRLEQQSLSVQTQSEGKSNSIFKTKLNIMSNSKSIRCITEPNEQEGQDSKTMIEHEDRNKEETMIQLDENNSKRSKLSELKVVQEAEAQEDRKMGELAKKRQEKVKYQTSEGVMSLLSDVEPKPAQKRGIVRPKRELRKRTGIKQQFKLIVMPTKPKKVMHEIAVDSASQYLVQDKEVQTMLPDKAYRRMITNLSGMLLRNKSEERFEVGTPILKQDELKKTNLGVTSRNDRVTWLESPVRQETALFRDITKEMPRQKPKQTAQHSQTQNALVVKWLQESMESRVHLLRGYCDKQLLEQFAKAFEVVTLQIQTEKYFSTRCATKKKHQRKHSQPVLEQEMLEQMVKQIDMLGSSLPNEALSPDEVLVIAKLYQQQAKGVSRSFKEESKVFLGVQREEQLEKLVKLFKEKRQEHVEKCGRLCPHLTRVYRALGVRPGPARKELQPSQYVIDKLGMQ